MDPAKDRELLTPREREVMELLAKGWLDKEIAAKLKISRSTVNFHKGHIFAKTGASRKWDLMLVDKALQCGPDVLAKAVRHLREKA